jgi:uncharacterized protein (PEP-CTERM system associated)
MATTRWSHITWALDASHVQNTYSRGRDTDGSHYGITLSYRFNPQFQVSLLGGRESNDYVSLDQETNYTRGFGVDWTPDLRTQLAATVQNRFFGTGYDVNFRHRMRRSLVTFLASRDVTSQPSGVSNTGLGSNYDASYALIAASNPELSPSEIEAQVTEVSAKQRAAGGWYGGQWLPDGSPASTGVAAALIRHAGCSEYGHADRDAQ